MNGMTPLREKEQIQMDARLQRIKVQGPLGMRTMGEGLAELR